MEIKAKPQLNGNTEDDFTEAYRALLEAQSQLAVAAGLVRARVVHGRNYQHIAFDANYTLRQDAKGVDSRLVQANDALEEIASAIAEAMA